MRQRVHDASMNILSSRFLRMKPS